MNTHYTTTSLLPQPKSHFQSNYARPSMSELTAKYIHPIMSFQQRTPKHKPLARAYFLELAISP